MKPREDMNSVRRSCAYLWGRCHRRINSPFQMGKTNLSSKLSSGWPEARVCLFWRLSGAVLLTVNIQAQPPQLRVEFTECIFNGPYHVRNMIFLRRSSPIIRRGRTALSLYVTKVAAACNPHVFGLYYRQRERLFGSRYRWHRQM